MDDFTVLDSLKGTELKEQTYSLNIFVANNNFLVAAGKTTFTVELFINESGDLGTWPGAPFSVTGYLMDGAGNALGSSVVFQESGAMPAQIWPGWPYYLPDGRQYLPATLIYKSIFSGERIYGNPNGYYVVPVVFSGIHFDITCPNDPGTTVIGGRLVLADFDGEIFVSPDPVPDYSQYLVNIPEPALTLDRLDGADNSGQFSLKLSGTPDFPYILQSTANLAPPVEWLSVMTNSADTNGNWFISITNVPSNSNRMFFRAVSWPWPPPP